MECAWLEVSFGGLVRQCKSLLATIVSSCARAIKANTSRHNCLSVSGCGRTAFSWQNFPALGARKDECRRRTGGLARPRSVREQAQGLPHYCAQRQLAARASIYVSQLLLVRVKNVALHGYSLVFAINKHSYSSFEKHRSGSAESNQTRAAGGLLEAGPIASFPRDQVGRVCGQYGLGFPN